MTFSQFSSYFSKVNRALNNILMIKDISLVSRHHQASQLEPHTQYHIIKYVCLCFGHMSECYFGVILKCTFVLFLFSMVENLVKKHPDSWHVHLPVSVLRFNCSVHPETKHRPLVIHRCEGNKPYTSPRDQPVCILFTEMLYISAFGYD